MADIVCDLIEAWEIHNDINLFIVDWVPDEGLEAVTLLKTGKPSRGRNVARIFSHMHEVRCSRLERAGEAGELLRFTGLEVPDRKRLREALANSGAKVAAVIRAACEEGAPIKGWKRSPASLLAYWMVHEAHHRGQIAQALKQSGVRPPDEISWGTWGHWGGYALKFPE